MSIKILKFLTIKKNKFINYKNKNDYYIIKYWLKDVIVL